MLRDKQVVVDGEPISQFNHLLVPGNKLVIEMNKPPEKNQLPRPKNNF